MAATEEVDTGGRRRRRRRIWIGAGTLAAIVIVFVLVWFEPQAAFIDDSVDESLPGLDAVLAAGTTVPAAPTTTEATGTIDTAATAPTVGATVSTVAGSAAPDEPTPAAPANSLSAALRRAAETDAPVVVSSGTFISGEHDTAGTALVVALPDGSLVVRFEDLDTSNGPDLRVVLSPEPASDSWKYDDRLHLGELKGNLGDQNYGVDAGVDLTGYRSVVIWCERFSVAFGAAPIDVVA